MRKFLMFISFACFLMLAGCSSADIQDDIQREIDEALMSDEDHAEYLKLKEQGLLDENGMYIQQDGSQESAPQGDIYITFADNANLEKVSYYYDAELTIPIDGSCYLNTGDVIYADIPAVKSGKSNIYEFAGFMVWSVDSNGNNIDRFETDGSNNIVFKIPSSFDGEGLSVQPFCKDRIRRLTFTADAIDEHGERIKYDGVWNIDGNSKRQVSGSTEISSVDAVNIKFEYDADKFFCTGTSPATDYVDKENGIVYFTSDITKDADDYSVQLQSYINGHIRSEVKEAVVSVSVNSRKINHASLHDMEIPKLKYGDTISVTTGRDYKVLCEGISSDKINFMRSGDGYCFTIAVPEGASQLRISTKKWMTKKVTFEMPEKSFWQSIGEWFHDVFTDTQQDKLFTVSCGENGSGGTYDFEKLKYAFSGIELKECDKLTVSVSDDIRHFPNIAFRVTVNNSSPVILSGSALSESYSFGEVDNVRVELLQGYVFSRKNINSGDIKMKYTLGGREIKDGEFLPVGSVVCASAYDVPPNYRIEPSVEGNGIGDILISTKTTARDFEVKYTIVER